MGVAFGYSMLFKLNFAKRNMLCFQAIMYTAILEQTCISVMLFPRLTWHDSLLESLLSRLPVDHIPNSREVLCLAVLILEVVSMLPRVNTKQRSELSNDRILVRVCLDADRTSLCVLHKPCPTRTLDTSKRSVELLFHGVEATVGIVDGSRKLSGWWFASTSRFGGEILPEEAMVGVSACMHSSTEVS